jgi:hypothetical protein
LLKTGAERKMAKADRKQRNITHTGTKIRLRAVFPADEKGGPWSNTSSEGKQNGTKPGDPSFCSKQK